MEETAQRLSLTRERILALLDALEGWDGARALTVTMPPTTSQAGSAAYAALEKELPRELIDAVGQVIEKSSTGIVVFWGDGVRVLVSPPFPVLQSSVAPNLDTKPLRELLGKDYLVGVVLLRLGRYAMGVFKGYEVVATKSGSRLVHGRHRAGGSSQRRFERRREKQIFEILKAACEEATEKFGPYERQLDYMLLGGERHTLLEFKKQCRFMQRMEPRILSRVLPVDEPSHVALLRMPREVYKSQAWVWRWPEGVSIPGLPSLKSAQG